MRRNTQLSSVLHVLLHMAERKAPMTSDDMAQAMNTHPVVARRLMAGLRERGYVRSEKGHGGGWVLVAHPAALTLGHIYSALGAPPLLAMGNRSDAPDCLVEQAVNATLDASFKEAEALLLARFGEVTLADVQAAVHRQQHRRGCAHALGREDEPTCS